MCNGTVDKICSQCKQMNAHQGYELLEKSEIQMLEYAFATFKPERLRQVDALESNKIKLDIENSRKELLFLP